MMHLGIAIQDLIHRPAVMDPHRVTGVGHLVVVFQDVIDVGLEGDLFGCAVGEDAETGVAHGGDVHGPGSGGLAVEFKELDHALGADAQEMTAEARVFKKVDIKLIPPDLECQVLDPRGIDVAHDLPVLALEILDLLNHLGHGVGTEDIRDFQLHHRIFREVERHGPREGVVLVDDLAAENRGKHDHAEGDEGPRLRIRIAEPYVAESLVQPSVDLHPCRDPGLRVKIVFPAKGDAILSVKPVRIKADA